MCNECANYVYPMCLRIHVSMLNSVHSKCTHNLPDHLCCWEKVGFHNRDSEKSFSLKQVPGTILEA